MIGPQRILAFLQSLGWPEMLVVGLVALLIFGRRLPEVGRSLGKGIVEFKKGLKDTGDQLKDTGNELKESLPSEADLRDDESTEQKRRDAPEKGSNSP